MKVARNLVIRFFSIFPKAISFALIASLIEALFMLPLHYYDLTPKKKVAQKTAKEANNAIKFLDYIYFKGNYADAVQSFQRRWGHPWTAFRHKRLLRRC